MKKEFQYLEHKLVMSIMNLVAFSEAIYLFYRRQYFTTLNVANTSSKDETLITLIYN